MKEIDKKIQECKNEKIKLENELSEYHSRIKVRQAEISAINSFIDILNDLKDKLNQNQTL